jgi:hypothetical protein
MKTLGQPGLLKRSLYKQLTPLIIDDRFIVKQLSSWEVDVLSSFLPAYFSYLADCLFKGVRSISKTRPLLQQLIPDSCLQQPTVLAKIFGIYRISFGKKYKNLDFLVMEVSTPSPRFFRSKILA